MMRALFSGVSGLKVHQARMDVIGNNIANVNTTGFKASHVNFSDVFYQTTKSASGHNAETGTAGQNAMQIGLGSGVASITTSITQQGSSQRTDNPFDVMINGDGFFVVNNGGRSYFTRDGSFQVDNSGYLATSSGASVMGWQVDSNDPTKTKAAAVSALKIMSPENLTTAPEATTKEHITGNIDGKDTQLTTSTGKIVTMSFYDSLGQSYTASLQILHDSADAANTYRVSITDIKDSNSQSIFAKKTVDPTTGAVTYAKSSIESISFGGVTYNTTVEPVKGKVTLTASGNKPLLTFNGTTGEFTSVGGAGSKSLALTINETGTNPFKTMDIDFSSLTQYGSNGASSLKASRGDLDGMGMGKAKGNMSGLSIDSSGKIYATYDNDDRKLLGQVVVATFSNPSGLEAVGNNMFAETQNSGEFDGQGQDPSQGGDSLTTGVLEMSNVDLASQFTDMITTQRGFQANSRIITTSDTLLEELINLKR